MDPIEVEDWTRGQVLSLRDKIQRSIDAGHTVTPMTEWEQRLVLAALDIAGEL